MNKIFKTILIASLAILGAGVLFVLPTNASVPSLTVEYSADNGTSWSPLTGSIFNETNFLPGNGVTRLIKVTNNSGTTKKIATETINENDPNNFASQLKLEINQDITSIFNDTLEKFFNQGETYLSSLENGANVQYDFTITFDSGSENEYQEKSLGFDILVGFQGEDGTVCGNGLKEIDEQCDGTDLGGQTCLAYSFTGGDLTCNTNCTFDTSACTGGGNPPGGGGPGGSVVWPPGLFITNEASRIIIEDCSVTISWNTSYGATSQVIYGPEGGNHLLDLSDNADTPPFYGYAYTSSEDSSKVLYHEVSINNLTPNTTYYYRCVSHASPATIGFEYSFNCGSCGQKGEVAGTSTEAQTEGSTWQATGTTGPVEEVIKEVAGAEEVIEEVIEEPEETQSNLLASIGGFIGGLPCLPWWLILILSAYCLIKAAIIHQRRKKQDILLSRINAKKELVWFVWSSIFMILAFCFYFTSYYCINIRILTVLVLVIFLTWYFLSKIKQKQID